MSDHNKTKYKRILLKLSGEALKSSDKVRICPDRLLHFSEEIKSIHNLGIEISIVIGGGNIFRGMQADKVGIDRVQGDYMGMLATVINAMALQSSLETLGIHTRLMSGIKMEAVAEPYIKRRAVRHLEKGRVVIFGSGTGHPYFTTDSAASLRSIEINADVILKGTRVNGVYNDDPEKNPNAVRYDKISFKRAYDDNLHIMDKTAFTLCQENKLPIVVFDITKVGNLKEIIFGNLSVGTTIN